MDLEQVKEKIKSRMRSIKISDEDLRKMIKLYEEKASVREIADVIGISEVTVRKYLNLIFDERQITEKQIEYIMLELKKLFDMRLADTVNIQRDLTRLSTKQARVVISYINRLKQLKNLESYIVKRLVPSLRNVKYKFFDDYKEVWK